MHTSMYVWGSIYIYRDVGCYLFAEYLHASCAVLQIDHTGCGQGYVVHLQYVYFNEWRSDMYVCMYVCI